MTTTHQVIPVPWEHRLPRLDGGIMTNLEALREAVAILRSCRSSLTPAQADQLIKSEALVKRLENKPTL